MYMRMVHVNVRPGAVRSLRQVYDAEVLSALGGVPGCLHAGLFQDVRREDRCVSLTVWSDVHSAETYARDPLFRQLIDKTAPFFSESEEYTVRLSESLKLEEVHLPAEPEVSAYAVEATTLGDASRVFFTPGMTIRTVKLSLRPGALESFVKVYSEGALPLLRNVPGCLHVFLIVPADRTEEVVSVSLWSDRSAVEGYERSGLYARLLEAQEELLSPLYRLRLTHEKEHGTQAASSEDVSVRHYALITGRTYAR